jgi:hypothetical protein
MQQFINSTEGYKIVSLPDFGIIQRCVWRRLKRESIVFYLSSSAAAVKRFSAGPLHTATSLLLINSAYFSKTN